MMFQRLMKQKIRVAKYQAERYNTDDEYKEKKQTLQNENAKF
jgi:hypothetical protein